MMMIDENPYASPNSDSQKPRELLEINSISRIGLMAVFVLVMTIYCVYQFNRMTPDTSFEHHPYSGPLIFMHPNAPRVGAIVGMAIAATWGLAVLAFPIRPNLWTLVISILAIISWFGLSLTFAYVASV